MKKIFYLFLIVCPLLFVASCEEDEIHGCIDSQATNYNSEATIDNNSCQYLLAGCTDDVATNYNPDANTDDGSCEYSINGTWGIDDLTFDGISAFNQLLEDYIKNGEITFNDDGSLFVFLEYDSSGSVYDNGSWVLIGTNQLILYYSGGDEEVYTITQLNATNCELSMNDNGDGNMTLSLSR